MDKVEKDSTNNTSTRAEVKAPEKALSKFKGTYIIKNSRTTWLAQMDKNHDGAQIFSEAVHMLPPDRDQNTGLIKTGLTEQEARELEQEMGLKTSDLSPYSSYWNNHKIYARIPKAGLELRLERSALDKLMFCYLRVKSNVSLSQTDALENPLSEYVMTSAEREAKDDSKKAQMKLKASKALSEMSITQQIDFLKVFEEGKYKVSKSSTPDFILATIFKIADEQPQAFLDMVDNPDLKMLSFVHDCIFAGHLRKSGSKYFIPGGDLIGNSIIDTVHNLQKPEYQEVYISLKAKLQVSN